jgi:hypothetical protein
MRNKITGGHKKDALNRLAIYCVPPQPGARNGRPNLPLFSLFPPPLVGARSWLFPTRSTTGGSRAHNKAQGDGQSEDASGPLLPATTADRSSRAASFILRFLCCKFLGIRRGLGIAWKIERMRENEREVPIPQVLHKLSRRSPESREAPKPGYS